VAVISLADDDAGSSDLLALGGVPVGGTIFDRLLFEEFVAPHLPSMRPSSSRMGADGHFPRTSGRG